MKTILLKASLMLMVFAFGVTMLNAQDFTYGDLEYSVNYDDVTVTVTGHVDGYDASGTLNIPTVAYYNGNGYTVTMIDDYAFNYCRGLTGTLVIPNTIEEIGDDAFSHCGFTGVVTIPASVEWIGYTPFYNCNGIEGFVVDPNNEDYDSRDNCNAIIQKYDNQLIMGCKNSTIPNTVTSIAEDAFNHCTDLTSITIPSSVTFIGGYSFWFTGLTSITIPSSVGLIGVNPFGGCAALTEIVVESGNPVYDSRNCCNAIIKTDWNEIITGCQNTVIPNDVTRIGDNAFYFCSTLSGELVIPEQITSIGEYAFEGCTGLTGSLVIPNSVNQLGESAFANCTGFDGTLTLSESLPNIQNWTFEGCQGFTGSLVIPNSVRTIGSSAFEDCRGFDGSLTLPERLASVGNFAFASCSGFKDVIILSETPPALGDYPFGGFGSTTLIVPCGCVPVYESSSWNEQFTAIYQDCEVVSENQYHLAKLYPNPTQGRITIEAEQINYVSVYNLIGEKVFESVAGGDAFEIDLGGMEKGLYVIQIATAKEILTKTITVM
ncbi:MAG: leucine-rich repeat domain-containing protein [Bacteroidales bacterium]|nr:leucine-rich repeat domain-containing protein [Bacteroidales bacterium]